MNGLYFSEIWLPWICYTRSSRRWHHKYDERPQIVQVQHLQTVEPNCFDVETRLKDMDTAKVNVQCISTVPVMFSYWAKPEHTEEVSRFVNDDLLAQCQIAPDRLIPLGTLPMNDIPRAVQVGYVFYRVSALNDSEEKGNS
ncbi:unnamed protein product [Strongylus vulgaris]|uniref:2-amino-3-carboxymuconate-6-semialdehyde decarboxylase n=1 Tax=Strongylus vulgaris TaxID=40348 RepID=A0A3P7JIQ6_STRVU|nr:unnamed protein product [Strongylus vulgaris]